MRRKTNLSEQITCCVADLETTNLSADFGVILCGVLKPGDGRKPIVFRGDDYPSWKNNRSNDKALVQDIVAELSGYDVWIIHNGAKFDIPYIRTRLLRHGLEALPAKKLIDPVLLARNKLRMSYNSLNQLANHLGVNSKTEVDPAMWLRASMDGNRTAMNYIVKHCVEDVHTLERVAGALKVYSTVYNTYGSGF